MSQDQKRSAQGAAAQAGRAGVSLSDAAREQAARLEGDAATRRALNALAVTSNLVSALIQHPGPNSTHASMVQAAREMLGSAHQTSQELVEKLQLGTLDGAPYRVMRLVSSAVADRWSATSREGAPKADVSDFMPVWVMLAQEDLPKMVIDKPATEPAAALRIAMLDAMQPVMHAISVFDMLHDLKEAAAHARDTMLVAAQGALAQLSADPMSDSSKSMLMQSLLRNAGAIYASAWRRHSEDTVDELQGMEKAEQAAILEKYPTGLPLEPIDEGFQSSFVKLVEMVQYLAAPKAPALNQDGSERPNEYETDADGIAPVSVGASA